MFLVTETKGPRGEKELTVVPRTWVRTTKQGQSILFWPSKSTAEVQKTMTRVAGSKPQTHWLRMECTVLRNCKTFSDGEFALEELSGQSSSEEISNSTGQHGEFRNFDDMFAVPPSSSSFGSITQSIPIPQKETFHGTQRTASIPTTSPYLEILMQMKQLTDAMKQERQEKNQVLADIKLGIAVIEKRQDKIEKAIAEVIVQQQVILEEMRKTKTDFYTSEPSCSFQPMETEKELADLEAKLSEQSYNQHMVRWLQSSVAGTTANKRMFNCLELLFTRDFQKQCTWTGMSRNAEFKTCISKHRNIINLFKAIGATNLEKVNDRKVALFFMQRFKNISRKTPFTINTDRNALTNSNSHASPNGIDHDDTLVEVLELSEYLSDVENL